MCFLSSLKFIQSRLQSCFPTIASRVGRNTRRNVGVSKRFKPRKSGGTNGRPKKVIVHKDLVVIPGPDTETHSSRVKLEEKELVCHEFPFNKEWDEATLKNEIFKQLPLMINCSHNKTDLKYHIKVEIYGNNGKNINYFRKKRN